MYYCIITCISLSFMVSLLLSIFYFIHVLYPAVYFDDMLFMSISTAIIELSTICIIFVATVSSQLHYKVIQLQ